MRNPTSSSRSQRRIIIADDESLIRLDLREMLISLGYDVIAEVGDGRTAESADRIALSPANAAISNLTNLHDDQQRPLGFGRNDTDYWHSDQEYRQSPATLASLYCLIPAERGGSTSFARTRVCPSV